MIRPQASEWDDDYEDDTLDILPGDIAVGEPEDTPVLLDRWGDPIEPTPPVIGFGR